MKPWSCGWRGTLAPAARALATSESTSSRLPQARQVRTSVDWLVSVIALWVKLLKNFSTSSMANRLSPRIMQVALSSVNCGLKVYPSFVKKSTERSRSLTGRFTKICACMTEVLFAVGMSGCRGGGGLLDASHELTRGAHFDAAEL